MKNLENCRIVIVLLSFLMLCQSCRVYNQDGVSLDDAVSQERRVKIKNKDGSVLKYKRIESIEGVYYGLKKKKGELIKTPIDTELIKKVRLHNKALSIVYGATIGFAVVLIASILVAINNLEILSGPLQSPN